MNAPLRPQGVSIVAFASSVGLFLAEEERERVRRVCRDWRRAAELSSRRCQLRVYHGTLTQTTSDVIVGSESTEEELQREQLDALYAVGDLCSEVVDTNDNWPDPMAWRLASHTAPSELLDVADAIVSIARPAIRGVCPPYSLPVAALHVLKQVVGYGFPVRDRLVADGTLAQLIAAIHGNENPTDERVAQQQHAVFAALVPFWTNPVPRMSASLFAAGVFPWSRVLDPSSPFVDDAMSLLAVACDIHLIQHVFNAGLLPLVVKCAMAGCAVLHGVRVLGFMCSGSDSHARAVVDAGGVDVLGSVLLHADRQVRREATLALSNLTAVNKSLVGHLVKHPTVVRDVVANIQSDECHLDDVQKESVWTIIGITSHGSRKDRCKLVEEHRAVEALCRRWRRSDSSTIASRHARLTPSTTYSSRVNRAPVRTCRWLWASSDTFVLRACTINCSALNRACVHSRF